MRFYAYFINYQASKMPPANENRTTYIPASIASNFNERLAKRSVAVMAGNTQTTEIGKPASQPVSYPIFDTTALNPAKAMKCITAVPPKMSGIIIFFSRVGLFSSVQVVPNKNFWCHANLMTTEKTVTTATGNQWIFEKRIDTFILSSIFEFEFQK